MESLVSNIPAGDRKTANLFFKCIDVKGGTVMFISIVKTKKFNILRLP
jgi:hypothetical protein